MNTTTKTWIKDENGNQCSVEYWGGEAAAKEALATLIGCSGCSDCSGCSGCSGCSDCSGCSGCSRCSDCSGCSRCSDCSDCSRCSDCSDCSRCSDCSGCSGCSGCSDCSGCSGCSDCSGCSRCSGCSDCSDCSDLQNAKPGASETEIALVPIIPNIHQRVYEAASAPGAFNMKAWHTCEKRHCRAGWVITLAGEAGKKLEQFFDPVVAAMKIYDASAPNLPKVSPVRFFEDDATALADMKRMAEMESAL